MINPWLSEEESECLRGLIGQRIVSILSPTLSVYENKVEVPPPASIRLEEGNGFLVFEVRDIPTQLEKETFYLESRPILRKSETPADIPFTRGKKMVVGPCSAIDMTGTFYVQSIEIFQFERQGHITLEGIDNVVNVVGDTQITFHQAQGRPISVWAGLGTLVFSRDMGLVSNLSLGLQRRLLLE